MNQTTTRLRRTGVGATVGALLGSALLFASPVQAADPTDISYESVVESQIAPNDTVFEGWHQGEPNGKYRVINEGLELTGPSQVLKGYPKNGSTDLADATKRNVELAPLAEPTFTKTGGSSLEMSLLVENVSGEDKAVTLSKADPAGDKWLSDKTITGTSTVDQGVESTLAEIKAAIGDNYRVLAFGVRNATGTSVVSSITFDNTKYLFANAAPVAKDATLTTKINTPLNVSLAATDADGNTLKYSVTAVLNGKLTASGATWAFTPKSGFTGNSVIKYAVDDDRGGVATATITVKVSKFSSKVSIYRVHPSSNKITTKSKVYVYAAVTVDGKSAPRGSTVYVYAKGKKVGTGKVNSLGKVKMALPNKLPKGKSTLKVTKVGSKTTGGSSASIAVRIKK